MSSNQAAIRTQAAMAYQEAMERVNELAREMARVFVNRQPLHAFSVRYTSLVALAEVAKYNYCTAYNFPVLHHIDCENPAFNGECPCWCHQLQPDLDIHFYRQTE